MTDTPTTTTSTTTKQYRLPDVGEGLTEAEIVRWLVKPGDEITVNQTVVEIETAKAAVELPSPYQGVVRELLVSDGETVDVGTPIVSVDVPAEPGEAPEPRTVEPAKAPGREKPQPAAGPTEVPAEERQPVLVGYGVRNRAAKRRPRKKPAGTPPDQGTNGTAAAAPSAPPRTAPPIPARPPTPSAAAGAVAVLAKPPVRKLAKDLGVDLAAIVGTGPHGTITRSDVESAAGARPATAPAVGRAGAPGGEERIPVRGVRKRTAEAMVASAFTAPQVTEFLQVDVTETVEATERIAALPEFAGIRVSPLLLTAKALLVAARRHPMVNSAWDEESREIVVKHYINLGIAVATERGLVVPNIKDAQAMAMPQLGQALHELVATARAGKTPPADMQGGTITITNVGVFGVDGGTPLLNPGEAAILALGQIRDMPWVVDGQVVPRKVTTLALSFDHRIVDGELGSLVLRDVGQMLEDPATSLAWS